MSPAVKHERHIPLKKQYDEAIANNKDVMIRWRGVDDRHFTPWRSEGPLWLTNLVYELQITEDGEE